MQHGPCMPPEQATTGGFPYCGAPHSREMGSRPLGEKACSDQLRLDRVKVGLVGGPEMGMVNALKCLIELLLLGAEYCPGAI